MACESGTTLSHEAAAEQLGRAFVAQYGAQKAWQEAATEQDLVDAAAALGEAYVREFEVRRLCPYVGKGDQGTSSRKGGRRRRRRRRLRRSRQVEEDADEAKVVYDQRGDQDASGDASDVDSQPRPSARRRTRRRRRRRRRQSRQVEEDGDEAKVVDDQRRDQDAVSAASTSGEVCEGHVDSEQPSPSTRRRTRRRRRRRRRSSHHSDELLQDGGAAWKGEDPVAVARAIGEACVAAYKAWLQKSQGGVQDSGDERKTSDEERPVARKAGSTHTQRRRPRRRRRHGAIGSTEHGMPGFDGLHGDVHSYATGLAS